MIITLAIADNSQGLYVQDSLMFEDYVISAQNVILAIQQEIKNYPLVAPTIIAKIVRVDDDFLTTMVGFPEKLEDLQIKDEK